MKALRTVEVQEILEVVTRAAKAAIEFCKKQKDPRFGGYFCLGNQSGEILLLSPVLEVVPEKVEKYRGFAEEKIVRLSRWTQHVSSWQSKNDVEFKFGGAIRGNKYLYSFSGFPEWVDESVTIITAKACDGLSDERVAEILRASGNPVYNLFRRVLPEQIYTT